jgi:hypothetical protein
MGRFSQYVENDGFFDPTQRKKVGFETPLAHYIFNEGELLWGLLLLVHIIFEHQNSQKQIISLLGHQT